MKYVDEFRDGALAQHIAASIAAEADPARSYNLMEFCGGHTHAISRYGVADLLPPPVRMIHGPGCPVCVLPIGRVDLAISLALVDGVAVGDYVILHVGYALSRLDPEEAARTLELFASARPAEALP